RHKRSLRPFCEVRHRRGNWEMRRQHREFELKVELPHEEAIALEKASLNRKLAAGTPLRKELRTIYFDTARYKLRKHGISLRLRDEGGAWVQTVKSERSLLG